MTTQLTLGVGLKDEATFANYYSGSNDSLMRALRNAAQAVGERIIYVCGTNGDGRTHLLQACCHEATTNKLTSAYIPLMNLIGFSPDIFDGLECLKLVCINDLQVIAGRPEWEETFFHAYNRIHDTGGYLVMTANVIPKSLGVTLPDLASRLSAGMVFQLNTLTDEEKLRALMMRAERRGLTMPEEVGKFILTHCPRHMSTLFAALEVLDKMSLMAQRKLTIPFVKTVLQI